MNEKEKISLNDVKALRESQDEMLRELYKEKYLRTNSMVAQVANSGNNTSYLCVVKNDWAANNLKLFFQMDSADKFVNEEIGPNGETTYSIEIDNASSEEFKQRMPDHSRADLISRYLITQPNRQLPTIMAVVEADWVTLQPDDPR